MSTDHQIALEFRSYKDFARLTEEGYARVYNRHLTLERLANGREAFPPYTSITIKQEMPTSAIKTQP